MKYLLDTNILSEMRKSNCDLNVKYFTDQIPIEDMFICSISIGELSFGIEKLPAGRKKHELSIWFYTKLPEWFNGRIISLDAETMLEWGKLRAGVKRSIPVVDLLIASAAITHHLTLVTRNTRDFECIGGINVINPWEQ